MKNKYYATHCLNNSAFVTEWNQIIDNCRESYYVGSLRLHIINKYQVNIEDKFLYSQLNAKSFIVY